MANSSHTSRNCEGEQFRKMFKDMTHDELVEVAVRLSSDAAIGAPDGEHREGRRAWLTFRGSSRRWISGRSSA